MPIIIYQVFNLIDNVLKFPTEVSFEWIPYRDPNNRLKYESIPAITVYYENNFQKFLFDEKVRKGFEFKFNDNKYQDQISNLEIK